MPKKTLSPPRGQLLRASCPWFRECNSPLCPLDPDLEQKDPPKLTPYCYWFLKTRSWEYLLKIPSHILDNLTRYVVHLINLGVTNRELTRIPRHADKIHPRLDDLGKVKGIV
ncbi:hypothetical protein ES705_10505 [subsurface metagenome]